MVKDAAATKAPIARLADKVAGVFVPAVIGIAFVTLIAWLIAGREMSYALERAITVLVISCPCSLGLATPVAVMVGNGVGAKNGILFKTAVSLENAGKSEIVALDKTGTITKGEPVVTDLIPGEGMDERRLLALAGALEKHSEHPLARAVRAEAEARGIECDEVEQMEVLPGNGIRGMLRGKCLVGGSLRFIQSHMQIPVDAEEKVRAMAEQGKTPLLFGMDDQWVGMIAVADPMKDDSADAIRQLKNMGIHVVMLTGDNARTAAAIGKNAGVDEVISDVLPDGKEQVIRSLQRKGHVIMVGDGINDAPALTRADLGMAIGAGTDVAIDAADIVLIQSRLSDAAAAIRLSRATIRNIHENLFWAFIYNIIGIPLAAGLMIPIFGWELHPMFGAAAMSDRKRQWKERKTMEKTLVVDGMMCQHCEKRVKKALENVDGVLEANVSHEKGTAVVTLSKDVDNALLKKAVEDQDYTVKGIQ